jgi:hypothetical protein
MLLSPRYTGPMPYFDPAVAPMKMVDDIGSLSAAQALDLFVSSNAELAATVEALDEIGWPTLAESPLGAVPIRLLMSHALWDSWAHERDILLPLGMEPTVVADESSRASAMSRRSRRASPSAPQWSAGQSSGSKRLTRTFTASWRPGMP